MDNLYCTSLTQYIRRKTVNVQIGNLYIGSDYPIRVQSMTTIDTMDTQGSVQQAIRMIEAGCELVRITAPSIKEAQNLENIKNELRKLGYHTPLVADIHFTPNAAELAARIVEKVRINPGNYADRKRFESIQYTEKSYMAELERIREKFLPLVKICKEYGTAMRIGTNHGSLSDRIMSRYGDNPLGMVESALEFVKICEDAQFYNIIISMKSSNPQVMVQAYRMLVHRLHTDGHKPYPLHLGVTEAGEAEDGRIKSAVGIGTLLEDGLGDTVRVSLTEAPECEMPVAQKLIHRYTHRAEHKPIKEVAHYPIHPFEYTRRKSAEVANIGAHNVPRVIADLSHVADIQYHTLKSIGHHYFALTDKWVMTDQGADYIYTGLNNIDFMLPNGLKQIVDYENWVNTNNTTHIFPMLTYEQYINKYDLEKYKSLHFIKTNYKALTPDFYNKLKNDHSAVLVLHTHNTHAMAAIRRICFYLYENEIYSPIIIQRQYDDILDDELLLHASTDIGGLLIDGFGDGILLSTELLQPQNITPDKLKLYNHTAFGILQAARTRMSKTEYISCPSCGRTLFDLQDTTAMIRKRTDHLKGLKIGIMGCIVNGPGEMADADFGYVGVGKDKIALYKGKEVVNKSVPASEALDELINLIKAHGMWVEP
ncbi:MAG: (E)-4-hydroxy-3-methylbut-2-enyl-diphosphate synthase [Cytophagales bacterium]|nr:(E)-4-hydroxy-3-methylbut-2-enyl-diphosphate synthase [Cytophagales bacterium]